MAAARSRQRMSSCFRGYNNNLRRAMDVEVAAFYPRQGMKTTVQSFESRGGQHEESHPAIALILGSAPHVVVQRPLVLLHPKLLACRAFVCFRLLKKRPAIALNPLLHKDL